MQRSDMQAVAIPHREQELPDRQFGKGVPGPHRGHRTVPLLWRERVHVVRLNFDRDSLSTMTMLLVMVDIAKRDEILGCIPAPVFMMPHMVQFQHFPGILRR